MLRRKPSPSLPREPVDYPVGTFVHSPSGYYFIHSPDKRLKIISKRCLDSWAPIRVVETSNEALSRYRVYSKLKFRNGSLLHSFADGRLYLVVGGQRRPIVSPDVFDRIGAQPRDATSVSLAELELHPLGEELA
jgi:hypothetical protein